MTIVYSVRDIMSELLLHKDVSWYSDQNST